MSHDVVTNVTEACDKSVTREEKRREDQNRSEEKKKPPKSPLGDSLEIPSELDRAFHTEEFKATWGEWVEHKKQKRSKLTPIAIRKQVKLMNEIGPQRSTTAINASIMNGWSGIFKPDVRGDPRNDSGGDVIQQTLLEMKEQGLAE